jgi:UDP-N-acetylmuramoyl-L-alanyl-D-glutamate--2,6-diaminopimelate ligase
VRAWDVSRSPDLVRLEQVLVTNGVAARLGGDPASLLDLVPSARTLIKSPGMRLDSSAVLAARGRGLTVIDEAELGWRLDSRPLVGITGTNGKSTTVALTVGLLRAAGHAPVLAGNTVFGPPLSAAASHPGDVVVAEISSFQLAGSPALLPEAAVFTNLSFEHWGWHGGGEAYRAAKATLFVRGDECVPRCAINVDDRFGRTLARDVTDRGGQVVRFGWSPVADYRLTGCRWDLRGSDIRLSTPHGEAVVHLRLPGPHNAMNAAATLALAHAVEIDSELATEALAQADPPPGRFELIDEGQGFDVVVDYANTVDSVLRVAETSRGILDERGAGMLRMVGSTLAFSNVDERAAVGWALADQADHLVLTTQRATPGEPAGLPAGFLDGALSGEREPETLTDRGAAIRRAIESAQPGDIVLILGRGALDGPLLGSGGERVPFDDRVQARVALRALEAGALT